ncbi:MAG: LacI family DNA-binding transcriptional regulator [Terracidiphilus sp.]|nr:LacI family DNA-binding transcriptional regulator [Terracidiphilus sp.]MDR3775445.1 LacI family DNA-binding transcriptional regulator [Terracidiphilus sp.]
MAKTPLKPISLKELAATLELSQSTVSRIVNGAATAHRIAKETQQRVLQAAALYGYSANTVARSLRQKRTFNIGVIVPEISEGYSTAVLSGIEDELLKDGFFYFVVSHRHRADLLKGYPRMMLARSVEGIIAVDTQIEEELPIPLVAVSGHNQHLGVINIELDHEQAAHLALEHLKALGHKHIAFIKGQVFSSDTDQRWQAIVNVARTLGIAIDPRLVVQLRGPEPGTGPGFEVTQDLLRTGHPFTAIFAFNDVTAIGAILALREAGLHVPQDVSVVGFDDVLIAATNDPALTTIHQPLRVMGRTAASTLLKLIRHEIAQPYPAVITVYPSLVARKSTGQAPPASPGIKA